MRTRTVPLVLLLVTGCVAETDNTVPTPADVDRVEKRLAKHPCIGNLDQWERNYRFSRKRGLFSPYSLNPDLDVLDLHLRRVDTISIRPGRHVWAARHDDWPDSQPIQTIDGRFRLADNSLSLSACKAVGPS
jgi:hypothetical protein